VVFCSGGTQSLPKSLGDLGLSPQEDRFFISDLPTDCKNSFTLSIGMFSPIILKELISLVTIFTAFFLSLFVNVTSDLESLDFN